MQMNSYLAFLRGINLGRRRVKMAALRDLFEQLNFKDVATFITSGNVLFAARPGEEQQLRKRIEVHLRAGLGYDVDVFLRTTTEVTAMAQAEPFSDVKLDRSGGRIYVVMLHATLTKSTQRQVLACQTPVDHLRFIGRELYWHCQIRSSDSTLWTSPQMRALKLPATTMRNMTTINQLHALCEARATRS